MTIVATAGPFSNLMMAVVCGLAIRFTQLGSGDSLTGALLWAALNTNLFLMFFNLIPIPPLDGSKILSNFLPFEQSVRYDRVMGQYGFMILIALVVVGGRILIPLLEQPTDAVEALLTGFRFA